MKKLFILGLLSVLGISAFCQSPSEEETLDYINSKFKSRMSVRMITEKKSPKLILDFMKSEGVYRIDRVYPETLISSKTHYNDSEHMLILNCGSYGELEGKWRKFEDACIERELKKYDKQNAYGRLSIDVEHLTKKDIEGLKKAFNHLIDMKTNEEYKETITFE